MTLNMMISKGMTGALPRVNQSRGNDGCILSYLDNNKQKIFPSGADQRIQSCRENCTAVKHTYKFVVEKEVIVACVKAKQNFTQQYVVGKGMRYKLVGCETGHVKTSKNVTVLYKDGDVWREKIETVSFCK